MAFNRSETAPRWLRMGRKQFVWRFGVLGWGVSTGVMYSVIRAFEEGWDQFPMLLGISLVMFPLFGILWGRGMWRWLEHRRAKATAK